jgi:hypothetical protein
LVCVHTSNIPAILPDCQNFSDSFLEILYATLVSWDMNNRRAKMRYFDDFRANLSEAGIALSEVEKIAQSPYPEDCEGVLQCLKNAYEKLDLMESDGHLVSNSKCLHFLFPSLCMPMDRTNTLNYLYGNTNESVTKYKEAARFSFEIVSKHKDFVRFRDNEWNASIPKMIDNAIILLRSDARK